jgi:DNA-binding NtrC family response regulator
MFTTLLVLFLMQLGIEITWSLFLPFTTLIFVTVYLFTKDRNNLFRLLVNVPFSKERKAYKQLNARVLEYISKTQTDEPLPLKKIMSDIEQTFINNALEIKDGNLNLAAELLSISISTVYRYKDKGGDKKPTR